MTDLFGNLLMLFGIILASISLLGVIKFKALSSKINSWAMFDVAGCSFLLLGLAVKTMKPGFLVLMIFYLLIAPTTTYLLNQLPEDKNNDQ